MSLDTLGGWKRLYGTLNDFVGIQTAHTASLSHCHIYATIMTDFGAQNGNNHRTQGQRQIFIRFWTFKTKFQTKIVLSQFSPDLEIFSVYEFRMDDIYPFLLFPALSEHNVFVILFFVFFYKKKHISRLLGTPPLIVGILRKGFINILLWFLSVVLHRFPPLWSPLF